MTKKWRCTVCDYVHEGPKPPDICPVCSADKSAFVREKDENKGFLRDMLDTFVLHGVAAHFPNGLLPTVFLFLILTMVWAVPHMEAAIFFILVVVLAAIPITFFSGILDWKRKFQGAKLPIFFKKIACGCMLFVLGVLAVSLRTTRPELWDQGGWIKVVYIAAIIGMLLMTVLLGHFGGKLVFHWKGDNKET